MAHSGRSALGHNLEDGLDPEDVGTTRKGFLFASLTNDTTYELRVRATTLAADGTTVIPGALDTASGAPGVVTLSGDGRIDMTASGFEVTTCSGTFSDGLGPYPLRRWMTLTLAPAIAGTKISVTFTSFDLEQQWDFLRVFDGDEAAGAVIDTFTGNALPSSPVTSESPDGKLTFFFRSDFSTVGEGWEATVSCVGLPEPTVVLAPGDGEIRVELRAPEDVDGVSATGFEYQMRESGGDAWTDTWMSDWILTTRGPWSIFTFPSLANGTEYEFRFRATTSGAQPGAIETASATPGIVMLDAGRVDLTASGSEVVTCSGTFSDGVGPYPVKRSLDITLAPDVAGAAILVTFTEFSLEDSFDFLSIYHGDPDPANLVGRYTGDELPPTILSTSSDGKLSFNFQSDLSVTEQGWEATISCANAGRPDLALSPGDAQIHITWLIPTAASGAAITGYEYQRREMGGDAWTETWRSDWTPTLSGTTVMGYTFSSLANGTTYEFRVRATTDASLPGAIGTASATPGVPALTAGRVDMLYGGEVETCEGTFSDGPGDYENQRVLILTLAPNISGKRIKVEFTTFVLEENDLLHFSHGGDAIAGFAGTFTGVELPDPASVASTSADGKLTFTFVSNERIADVGWEATISCVGIEAPEVLLSPGNQQIGVLWYPPDTAVQGVIIDGYEYQMRQAAGPDWTMDWDSSWSPVVGVDDLREFVFPNLTNDTVYEFRIRAMTSGTTLISEIATASAAPGVVTVVTTEGGVERVDLTASGSVVETCSGTFSDGLGDYEIQRSMSITLAPDTPGARVRVAFTAFSLEEGQDFLDVYSGSSIKDSGPDLRYTGEGGLSRILTSVSEDGALTFSFWSDGQTVGAGWEATISCVGVAAPRITLEPLNGMIGANWLPSRAVQGVAIDGYEYQMREEGDADWPANWESGWTPDVDSANNDLHEFVFTGLTNDTVYEFRIRAATSGGGLPSGIGTASAAPGIVTLSGDGRVDMTASGSVVETCSGIFSDGSGPYEIQRFLSLTLAPSTPGFKVRVTFTSFDTEPGIDNLRVYSGEGTATLLEEFSGSNLPAPVTSESQDGKLTFTFFSNFSLVGEGWEAEISCVSEALPGPPAALTATPSSASREVVLSWTPPGFVGESPVTGYQIESSPDGATDSWSVLVADTGDANTYTHTNLNNGQIIHYRVSAINDQGVGEASNVVQATVATLPATPPGAPTNLTATSSGSTTTIVLNWTTPTDTGGATVTGYKIERSANGATAWMEVVANTGNVNTYSHTGLTDAETIHYRVFAINSEGQGATASNVAMATVGVEPITAPGAPTDLTATASGSTTTIVLSWTAPTDTGGATITGYKIERSEDGATGWMEVVADTGDVNTYSHTGLTDGETIHYRVFAINSEGAGATASNVAMATVGMEPFTVPGAPTNLTATSSGSTTTIVLRWTAPADTGGTDISGYRIESSEDGSTAWMEVVSNTGLSATTYSDTGLTDDETIHYRVFAINSEGQGATASNVAVATVGEDPPFSSSPHLLSTVKVYPNPAVDVLYLDLEEGPDYIMTLLSLTGQLVVEEVQKGGGSLRMALPNIRDGVYILRVEDSEGGVQSFKIVR